MADMPDLPPLIDRIAHLINTHADARQVYGEPVERDGTTIIPIARVQWGFGGGTMGQGVHERGGGGGGVRATPAGFIEIKNGNAEYRPYRDARAIGAFAGIALACFAIGLMFGKTGRR